LIVNINIHANNIQPLKCSKEMKESWQGAVVCEKFMIDSWGSSSFWFQK